jgi:hypothetical protein
VQAEADLPAGPRLARRKTRVARGLLFARKGSLPLHLFRSLTGALGGGICLRSQNLSLVLSLRGETRRFPLSRPLFPGLSDRLPRGLAGEDSRIIGRRARPKAGQRVLPRFGRRFETIYELVAFEGLHVRS